MTGRYVYHKPEFVYLIEQGHLCKIGVSHAPERRVASLINPFARTGYTPPRRVIGIWWCGPYALDVEGVIKAQFARNRASDLGTEWFALPVADVLWPLHRAIGIYTNGLDIPAKHRKAFDHPDIQKWWRRTIPSPQAA